jgi:hypothetical protein
MCKDRRSSSAPSRRILCGAITATMLALLPAHSVLAQGCVVARGTGVMAGHTAADQEGPGDGKLQTAVAYRWFKSDRAFVGTHEIGRPPGVDINRSHFIDVAITYAFNERFGATLTIPYARHERSSVATDAGGAILQRFSTHNSGLADLRLVANGWVLDPKSHPKGNVQLGIGVDLPTGDKDARDAFPTFDPSSGQLALVRRPVDQSIQLGDGGYGVLLSFYGLRQATERLALIAEGTYAVTPEETNGVRSLSDSPFERELSIADSYALRAGLRYELAPALGVRVELSGRIEGVPVHDVVGGSDGFRRPGYTVYVEPGVSAALGTYSLSLYAPIAVQRDRQRSVGDMRLTEATGVFQHGPAAFADYLVMFSLTKIF